MDAVLQLLHQKRKTRGVITDKQAADIVRFERAIDDAVMWCLAQGSFPELELIAAHEYGKAVRACDEDSRIKCAWIFRYELEMSWAEIARVLGFRTWKQAKIAVDALHQRIEAEAPPWWGWWHCLKDDMKRSHRAYDRHLKYTEEEVRRHSVRRKQIREIERKNKRVSAPLANNVVKN